MGFKWSQVQILPTRPLKTLKIGLNQVILGVFHLMGSNLSQRSNTPYYHKLPHVCGGFVVVLW